MEKSVSHYRPLYRNYQLNENSYCIIDTHQAKRRALYFYLQAKSSDLSAEQIDYYLNVATDYGCGIAPYDLARRILVQNTYTEYSLDDAIIFLSIAAQRGHQRAAYEMACCYSGNTSFPEILEAGADFFDSLSPAERELLATYYYSVASVAD